MVQHDGTGFSSSLQTFIDCLDDLFLPFMVMSGESFIPAAKKGFLMDLKYMENLYYLRDMFWFVLFMVKLLVTIISVLCFWLLVSVDPPEFYYGLGFPIVFVTLFNMLICFSTIGLFNHVMVAILVAMCVDFDLHGKKDEPSENMV